MTYSLIIIQALIYFSLLTLIVGVIIYKKVYKSNMNKALDGEARKGLFEPAQIVYILAVVVLIILSSISISKTNSLQHSVNDLYNRINHLQWQNDTLKSRFLSLESNINDYFSSRNLIQHYDYQLKDINEQELLIYSITFTLLEKETNSNVSIVLKDKNNQTSIIPLSSSSLVYTVDLEVEIDNAYVIDVLIEGASTIQENITKINVTELIQDSVWLQFEPIDYDGEKGIEIFGLTVVNDPRLLDELKTSSVVFEVFIDGVLTDTYSLFEKTKTVNGYDIFQVEYDISIEDMGSITFTVTITDNIGNVRVIDRGL